MADNSSSFFARRRRRMKRRGELSAAGIGDLSGDATRRPDIKTRTDPATNPVNAANPAWDTMKPPPG